MAAFSGEKERSKKAPFGVRRLWSSNVCAIPSSLYCTLNFNTKHRLPLAVGAFLELVSLPRWSLWCEFADKRFLVVDRHTPLAIAS